MSTIRQHGLGRDRRKVIASLAALLGAAGVNAITGPGASAKPRELTLTLCDVLGLDERTVAPLCTARARAQLASHLDSCGAQLTSLRSDATTTTLKRNLRERIAADYSRGQIVDIDGWQLASTEALVIALVARASA